MLKTATNQPKSTVELGYMCPRGLSGPHFQCVSFWLHSFNNTSRIAFVYINLLS